MHLGNPFVSALQFFLLCFLLFCGFFLVGVGVNPSLSFHVAKFLSERGAAFIYMGCALGGLGLCALFSFYRYARRSYYQVEMLQGGFKTSVELFLIRKNIEVYWKKLFPQAQLATHLFLHSNQKLELVAEMPPLPSKERHFLLERVEKELGAILSEQFAYEQEFLLTVILKEES